MSKEKDILKEELLQIKANIFELNSKILAFEEKLQTIEDKKESESNEKLVRTEIQPLSTQEPETQEVKTTSTRRREPKEEKTPSTTTKFNLINVCGAFSVLFAIGIFMKLAINKGFFPPEMRVILGYLLGSALVGIGEYCHRKNYRPAVLGFLMSGQSILFLTTWFTHSFFNFIPTSVAFAIYVLISALMVIQAIVYNSQLIASFGIFAALLVPILANVSIPSNTDYIFVCSYVLTITLTVLVISHFETWQTPKWISLIGSYFYLFSWAAWITFNKREISHCLAFIAGFFVLYSLVACYRSYVKHLKLDSFDLSLVIFSGILSVILALLILNKSQHIFLGIACLCASLFYVLLCGQLYKRESLEKIDFDIFLTVSVAFLCVSSYFILPSKFVTITWALLAMALARVSKIEKLNFLEFNYLLILSMISIRLTLIRFRRQIFQRYSDTLRNEEGRENSR